MSEEQLDFMVFGAHPDDVELCTGGTLAKLRKMGYRTGITDLTRGEMGSLGNQQIRDQEAEKAAHILDVVVRENLNMQDSRLRNSIEHRTKVAQIVRKWRPRVVACFQPELSRHPDHYTSGYIVKEGCYLAGLKKEVVDDEPFRPDCVIYFPEIFKQNPSFAVDITEEWETKIKAMKVYESQLYHPQKEDVDTQPWIRKKSFWDAIENRARFYGSMIGTTYAETFYFDGLIRLDDMISVLSSSNPN